MVAIERLLPYALTDHDGRVTPFEGMQKPDVAPV
jgi:hypothetical protein